MAYLPVYSPTRARTPLRLSPPMLPVRVIPPRAMRPVRSSSRAAVMRLQNGGTNLGELGIVPVLAAAIPSVRQLAGKAIASVIGIVDPGKKRDANRKARAQMWCDLANAGSITAARRVLGGSKVQYTPLERGYYQACWTALQTKEPRLAQLAVSLGGLGVPEPGSDQAPPFIGDEDVSALQREIDEYRNPQDVPLLLGPTAPKQIAAQAGGGNANVLLALGLVGAYLASKR